MDSGRANIEIRYSAAFGVIGWLSILFGLGLTLLCAYSHFQGNETATLGTALLFLGLFGSLGGFLVIYGGRGVTVCGTDIIVRNCLAWKRNYGLDDIKTVKVRWNGIVFYGPDGVLFKIRDHTMECEQFLQVLEKNGTEVDSPDRVFSRSQQEALNPVTEQRRFTVNLGWYAALIQNFLAISFIFLPFMLMAVLPWKIVFAVCWPAAAVLGASAWQMKRARLDVSGSRFELQRMFGRSECHTAADIREVRVRPWLFARRSVFRVKVFAKNGRLLFKLSCPALGYEDRNYVLAMLKYFRDCQVPVLGVEKLDEAFICLLERDYVTEEEGVARCRQVYGRLEAVFKEFVPQFQAYGVTLFYTALDRERRVALEKGLQLTPEFAPEFWSGGCFCLLREGRLLRLKGMEAPLYHVFVLLRGSRGNGGHPFFFAPVPLGAVHNMLRYLLQQTAAKRVFPSDRELKGSLTDPDS